MRVFPLIKFSSAHQEQNSQPKREGTRIDKCALLMYYRGVRVDPVGPRGSWNLLQLIKRLVGFSVQVKTWSCLCRCREKNVFFLLLFTDGSDAEARGGKSRFYSSVSGFIKGHQSCASLSPLPFILWKCDSLTACCFLTFPSLTCALCVPLSSLTPRPSLWSHMWKWSA